MLALVLVIIVTIEVRIVSGGVSVRVADAKGRTGAEGEEALGITVSEMLVVSGVKRHQGPASAGLR